MSPQNTNMHYFRTFVLLSAAILLPALAIGWKKMPSFVKDAGSITKNWFLSDAEDETPKYRAEPIDSANDSAKPSFESGLFQPMPMTQPSDSSLLADLTSFSSQPEGETGPLSFGAPDVRIESQYTQPNAPVAAVVGQYDIPYAQKASYSEAAPEGRYSRLEQELRLHGAEYYCLEKWGSQDNYFKFSCVLADGNKNQYFQAVDVDDVAAMQTVLQQIKQRQAASAPAGANF